jgi:hypothetical protein
LWLLTPLAIALAIAGITALPAHQLPPYAGDLPGLSPNGLPPPPAPAPSTPVPGSSPSGTPSARPTGKSRPTPGPSSTPPTTAAPSNNAVAAAAVSISLEAEAGSLGSSLLVYPLTGASGGSVVSGLGSKSSSTLTFPSVNVPVSREYHLRFWYAASADTTLRLATSAGTSATVYCPSTGGEETIGWYDTMVLLSAGTNTITVSSDKAGGLDLDRITLW